jgi:hypothetical protein
LTHHLIIVLMLASSVSGIIIIIEIKLLYCIFTSVLKLQLMPLKSHPCVTSNHGKYSCPRS